MKLLESGVGWLTPGRNKILWTNDDGRDWKDIAPAAPDNDSVISSAFFLDSEHGWVVFTLGEPGVSTHFDLATTDDGGSNWSTAPLNLPPGMGTGFNGGSSLSFADLQHGWLVLSAGLSLVSSGSGGVFATSDGGKTWAVPAVRDGSHASEDGGAAATLMVTPQFGWAVGGPINDELSVTRDGAATWQNVVLSSPIQTDQLRGAIRNAQQFESSFTKALPSSVAAQRASARATAPHNYYNDTFAHYELPVFTDKNHGQIVVAYPGVTVLFGTHDGGVTWKQESYVTGRRIGPSEIVGSAWISADVPKDGNPKLRVLGKGQIGKANETIGPELSTATEVSFDSPKEGWVLTISNKLFSTIDGGTTWTDITPSSL
jgi:photosystem II stability/assembly factor-like uncharacterized protein